MSESARPEAKGNIHAIDMPEQIPVRAGSLRQFRVDGAESAGHRMSMYGTEGIVDVTHEFLTPVEQ